MSTGRAREESAWGQLSGVIAQSSVAALGGSSSSQGPQRGTTWARQLWRQASQPLDPGKCTSLLSLCGLWPHRGAGTAFPWALEAP